jgi:hypothetical protein
MMTLKFMSSSVLALAFTSVAFAQTLNVVTLTMDEVPFQPINGLTVKGVTFADTAGAAYNAGNGGQLHFTQDPVIEGNSNDVITMTFANPVTFISFGIAMRTQATIPGAYTIQLYDPANNLIGTYSAGVSLFPGDAFSGGVFSVSAVGLISKAVLSFTAAGQAGASGFGFDNLTIGNPDEFQIRYGANLTSGDSVINITNSGANGASLFGPGFGGSAGNLCVNVYAFSPDEQLVSCCSCLVTPNGLVSLSVNNDLISNTLTGVRPSSVVVKLVSTLAGAGGSGTSCTNSAAAMGTLAPGLLAWGTTIHSAAAAGAFATTETPFSNATLSAGELASITNRCTNIIGNGSTFGICRSCRAGALGAANQ